MNNIEAYNADQSVDDRVICDLLAETITAALPDAVATVWHGRPVWFLNGNPIVGYHRQKSGLRVLFWSGQSFDEPALIAVGKFAAAGIAVNSIESFDWESFRRMLATSITVQWDYANLPRNKSLVKLTRF